MRASVCWLIGMVGGMVLSVGHAMELNLAKTPVWLGRMLDTRVLVKLDHPHDDPCFDVQLLDGENRLGVITQWQPDSEGRAGVLHIRSTRPVEEPVLTLDVAAGCQGRMQRKFVLLPEIQSERPSPVLGAEGSRPAPALPLVAASSPVPLGFAQPPAPAPRRSTPGPLAIGSNTRQANLSAASPSPTMRSPALKMETSSAVAGAASSGGAAVLTKRAVAGSSRLKVEPLDLSELPPVTAAGLKLSWEMTSPSNTTTGALTRAQARAHWGALSQGPQDWEQGQARMQQVQSQLGQLQQRLQQQQEAMNQVQQDMARQQWHAAALVGLCLLLGAGGGGWLLYRQGQASSRREAAGSEWPEEDNDAQSTPRSPSWPSWAGPFKPAWMPGQRKPRAESGKVAPDVLSPQHLSTTPPATQDNTAASQHSQADDFHAPTLRSMEVSSQMPTHKVATPSLEKEKSMELDFLATLRVPQSSATGLHPTNPMGDAGMDKTGHESGILEPSFTHTIPLPTGREELALPVSDLSFLPTEMPQLDYLIEPDAPPEKSSSSTAVAGPAPQLDEVFVPDVSALDLPTQDQGRPMAGGIKDPTMDASEDKHQIEFEEIDFDSIAWPPSSTGKSAVAGQS